MLEEDLEHFMIRYPKLECKRNKEIIEKEIQITFEEKTLHILFKNKQHHEVGKMIRSMWEYSKHRKDRLKPP